VALPQEWHNYFSQDPAPYAARQVYQALASGEFCLPTDRELGNQNTKGQVSFLILNYRQLSNDYSDAETVGQLAIAGEGFRQSHSGFRLGGIFTEAFGQESDYLQTMGFKLRTQRNKLQPSPGKELPELCGLLREEISTQMPGTHARDIFQFNPPVIGFTAAERRMLRLVVTDLLSDAEIAQEFSLSEHTVNKRWKVIYERVSHAHPYFFYDGVAPRNQQTTSRGPEKRRMLIGYLQQYLEELRPYYP